MGRYFDFTPVKPWAGGLGDVFAGVGDAVEYRDKKRVQDAELAQKKASTEAFTKQVEAQTKKLQMEEDRQARAFEQTQSDRDQAAAQKVTGAAAGGRMGEAQAYAAATQRVDPKTGKTLGVTFNPEDPGAAPPAPVAPEEPAMLPGAAPDAFVGPVEPPDVAKARAMAEVMGKRTEPPKLGSPEELLAKAAGENAYGVSKQIRDERGQVADRQLQNDINKSTYAGQKSEYDTQSAAYGKTKAAYDDRVAHPNFTVGVNGQQIKYNPREARDAKADEGRQTAAMLRRQAASPDIPNDVRLSMLSTANSIEAQLPAAAAGAISNAQSQSNAHVYGAAQGDANRTNARGIAAGNNRATIEAARLRGQTGGIFPGKDERPVITEFEHNVADVQRKGGLQEQLHHQESTLDILDKQPENPTNWTNLVDAMIRSNTGKAAILNQYMLYTGHAAGSLTDAVDQINERLTTGGLSDAQKANLYAAAKASLNETVEQWNQAADVAGEYYQDPRVQGSPGVKAGIDRTMHSAFRGGKRQPRTTATVPGRPNVPLPGSPAPAAAGAAKPAAAHAVGETKIVGGVTWVKDGPDHWSKQVGPPAP